MLQLYMDDSYTEDPALYVLGGVCATPEQWDIISKEWNNAVYLGWKLPYTFKYNQAMHWPDDIRVQRLSYLLELVRSNSKFFVLTAVDHAALQANMGDHPNPNMKNRFYFSYFNTLIRILQCEKRVEGEKVQFIFDTERVSMELVQKGWAEFKSDAPQQALDKLAHEPIFGNDETLIPLQVADFVAGWLRQKYSSEALKIGKFEAYSQGGTSCPILNCIWDDGRIHGLANDMKYFDVAKKASMGDIDALRKIFATVLHKMNS